MADETKKIPTAEEVISLYKKEVSGSNVNARRVVAYYVDEKCEEPLGFQDIIKLFLDCNAILDETFKKFYGKENKSLERCQAYVFEEMRKLAQKNVAVGSPKQVFGLCVHYYEEDDLAIDKAKSETVQAINNSVKTKPAPTMLEMEQNQSIATAEFDLFGL